jgi:hypothetical protein
VKYRRKGEEPVRTVAHLRSFGLIAVVVALIVVALVFG